jgi:hypothetical protein
MSKFEFCIAMSAIFATPHLPAWAALLFSGVYLVASIWSWRAAS